MLATPPCRTARTSVTRPDEHRLEELLGGSEALRALHRLADARRAGNDSPAQPRASPGGDRRPRPRGQRRTSRRRRDMGVYRVEKPRGRTAIRRARSWTAPSSGSAGCRKRRCCATRWLRLRVDAAARGGQDRAARRAGAQSDGTCKTWSKRPSSLTGWKGFLTRSSTGCPARRWSRGSGSFTGRTARRPIACKPRAAASTTRRHMEFSDRDPLVRWLQRHPRLITRVLARSHRRPRRALAVAAFARTFRRGNVHPA